MNKELSPLEAFNKITNGGCKGQYHELCEIVETALKEHELMKQARFIIADRDISDEDLEKLKNQRKFVSNLEQCEIKPLFDEETQKKLKALDILKNYLYIDDENTLRLKNKTNVRLAGIVFSDREVIDLLKKSFMRY